MSWSTLWRAFLAQTVAVASLFAVLLALPLPPEFFREQGAVVGPVSWILCSLAASRVVGLGMTLAGLAAVGSGLAAFAAALVLGHSAGMIVGVIAFAVLASLRLGGPLGARPGRARSA